MQRFEDKKTGESRNYTMAFTEDFPAGVTISTDPDDIEVDIEVYDKSDPDFPDTNPTAMLDGEPALNADAVCIRGRQVAINQAIIQPIKGGVIGCTYVVTFTAKLSNGRTFIEDALLTVAKYVPSGRA